MVEVNLDGLKGDYEELRNILPVQTRIIDDLYQVCKKIEMLSTCGDEVARLHKEISFLEENERQEVLFVRGLGEIVSTYNSTERRIGENAEGSIYETKRKKVRLYNNIFSDGIRKMKFS